MTRIYLQLQVDFDDDEKVARLNRFGRDARGCRDLLVGMWRYCKREKSDGHVPADIVGKLVYPDPPKNGTRDADRLVEVGIAARTPTGYFLDGFLKHNKSRAEIEAESARKAEAGRIGGRASGQSRKSEADTKQPASTPRSHSSENREQSSKTKTSSMQLGEQRTETLNPADARCAAHFGVAEPGPCRGCMKAREHIERVIDARRDAAIAAADNCPDCHGDHWLIDAVTGDNLGRCDHRRTA